MIVPFLDVGATYRELRTEIDAALQRVLDSGTYILGPEVEAFEAEWAHYCEARYAVGVASGLDALTLALRALDVGPGDEVIVPSNTFVATWLAVTAVGATPIAVEPHSDTYNIDVSRIPDAITSATKVIVPVHLYGQPADLEPILAIAARHGLRVVEDAAQAHGARYKNKRIGAHGDIVCWSFYPAKNLGAFGDGGAVTTDSLDLAEKVKMLRNYGSSKRYHHDIPGLNSRLDPAQAAVLRTKLLYLDAWTERRRAIARIYGLALDQIGLALPETPEWAEPVWHLYVVRAPDRDDLQKRLTKAGVNTQVHYPIPPHKQLAFASEAFDSHLPLASRLAVEVLSLPIGPHLGLRNANYVAATLRTAVAHAAEG